MQIFQLYCNLGASAQIFSCLVSTFKDFGKRSTPKQRPQAILSKYHLIRHLSVLGSDELGNQSFASGQQCFQLRAVFLPLGQFQPDVG